MSLSEPLIALMAVLIVFTVLYHYRSSLLLGLKTNPRKITQPEQERTYRRSGTTECPRCGGTMEQGYIIGPRGIYWSKNAPFSDIAMGAGRRFDYGLYDPQAEPLGFSPVLGPPGRIPRVKAYRCSSCGTIQVDTRDQSPLD